MTISFNKPIVCPVLIGRAHDLTTLRLLVDRAKSGQGQVALLSGEAGIGKTCLMAEIKVYAAAQNFLLFQGNCFPTDLSCPYAPLLDLLRSVIVTSSTAKISADMGPYARELAPLLPELTALPLDLAPLPPLEPEQEKRRLFAALTQLFINQAAKQPVLLIVEDLHWSDDTSLEFLHYLARRCVTQPLLLLLTYRSDEVRSSLRHWLAQLDREHLSQEVVLTRLTRSDTGAMLRAIFDLQRPVQAAFLDAIYTLTEGNPFFIEEILKSLIAAGKISYAHGAWDRKPLGELHIPRSIQDAVQLRSDQLSESAKQVLILAAVAGHRFDFAVLQQVTQHDEQQLLTLMKELMAAQLVVEESAEQFAFRHALTRQAIYAQLLARERKRLHRTIAETMEHLYAGALEAHLADLASHFSEAGLWEKALSYAQQAGERAQRLYAPRAAIEQLTWALSAANHLTTPPPAKLYRARGQAYETLGEFEQARRDYEQALEVAHSAHDGVAEWQSVIDLGFLWAERDYRQTEVYLRQALERARALADPRLLAHSLNRLGNWYVNVEQPLEALHYHQEALTIFQEVHDQHGVAETLDLLGMTSYIRGDLVQSAAYYRHVVELFREMDNREGLVSSLATLLMCGGSYEAQTLVTVATSVNEVLQAGERALSLARQIDQRSGEAYTCCCMADCLGFRGEYAHALKLAQEGLSIAEEIEHRQWITFGHDVLGLLYLDLLELTMARRHLEQALALAQEMGSTYWIRALLAHLASVCIELKDLAQAEALLTTALDSNAPPQTAMQQSIWYARAQLALAQGKPDRVLAITEQLFVSAANVSDEQSLPHLAQLRGKALTRLKQLAEAETALQIAREIASAQGARPMLWRICVDLGHLYHTQARHAEANQAFATARTLIEELATTVPDDRVRHHFLRQATAMLPRVRPLSPNRAAKQAFGGLTAREHEVATLIAQGKSNREIADALVVSYRTVETHVGTILSKLSLTSRAQIAVWALERELVKHSE
jgi:predicted ATPase/DNA-binding CsgD family transcriptional regulator